MVSPSLPRFTKPSQITLLQPQGVLFSAAVLPRTSDCLWGCPRGGSYRSPSCTEYVGSRENNHWKEGKSFTLSPVPSVLTLLLTEEQFQIPWELFPKHLWNPCKSCLWSQWGFSVWRTGLRMFKQGWKWWCLAPVSHCIARSPPLHSKITSPSGPEPGKFCWHCPHLDFPGLQFLSWN